MKAIKVNKFLHKTKVLPFNDKPFKTKNKFISIKKPQSLL